MHFGTAKGEVSIRFLDFWDLSYFDEKKTLMMFTREILSFVDFAGLDASRTASPLWGASLMWIISIPSNFIPVEPGDNYNVSVLHIGRFASHGAKDRDRAHVDF